MTTTNYQRNPDHLAKQLGIRVRRGPLPQGWWGLCDHPRRTIVLRPGLAPIQYTCTLMHELGHAYYGHEGVSGKQKLLPDRWAADDYSR
ncbi:hypothetical protein GCM10022377_22650 [Zhihengliuella alba]|uniref:IrrE N-terminal-like domain-containing protein n=1 Tax=Zhihengliuella alba TaxID=547018 RepID=A0ABP7DS07_9MICC